MTSAEERSAGLAAREAGRREDALRHFRAAATADPRDLWNRHDAAVELRELGRAAEAGEAFRQVVQGTPLPHALRGLAQLAKARGAPGDALDLFRAAAHLLPADPWFALDVATCLRALGRLEDAESACAAILANHPDFTPAGCERADLLGRLGRAQEAQTLYARLLVRDPGLAAAYRGLARLADEAGDPETAAAHLKAAARARPDDPVLHLELAGALKRAGRWDEARDRLRRLAVLPDTAVAARLELYHCARRNEGAGAAQALLLEAQALDPEHPRAALMLGDHHRENGDLDAAEAAYDTALRTRPDFYWALAGKAALARVRGDETRAAALLAQAIATDPAEGHAAIELAALHRDAGHFEAARAVLAAIPAHSPRGPQIAMAEGMLLRAEGRWNEAGEVFLAAARRFPNHVEALVEASEDFLRGGEDIQAFAALENARRRSPDRPAVLDALARRALSRDDHEEALAVLERAVAADPGRLWLHLALARLKATLGDRAGAFADLAACETRFGLRPEIALARIELLGQTGETSQARRCIAQARARFPHHAGLRREDAIRAIEDGRFEQADAILARWTASVPAGGAEAGRVHFLRSLLLAARWNAKAAITAGEAAVAALPGDGWVRNRLIHAALLDLDLDRAGRHLRALAALEAASSRAKGKSGNASQSHYGQIYDEFRLDEQAVDAVRQARALPPERRLDALGKAVGAFPDSTAAAIAVFIERRLAGNAQEPVEKAAIPRVIHQYWDEPAVPPDLAAYAASWAAMNPGFHHRLWNEADARRFIAAAAPETLAAFERAREPAMKADLFRLVLLREEGGIYADMDDRCIAGIAPLLEAGHAMIAYQEDIGSLGNNFVAASPRHPIVARALRLATAAVNRGDADILWLATGPGLLTRAAAQVLHETPGETDRLLLLDRHVFLRHVSIHCLAGYKATERHWSRTAFGRVRRPRGVQAATGRSA